jgi:UDP:flavonoid glycosyltransferase YjiC (YdhE family)
MERVRREGFMVHDVETLPQERMDRHVTRGQYGYYDLQWIDRCVGSERALINELKPDLVIHDLKPTLSLSARLEGVDEVRITQAYNQPGYPMPIRIPERFSMEIGPFAEYLAQRANQVKAQRSLQFMADIPQLHPPGKGAPGYFYVGPLLDRPAEPAQVPLLDSGWDLSLPLVYLSCGSSGRPPEYLEELFSVFTQLPYRLLVTTAGRWQGKADADNIRVVDFVPGEWVLRRAQVLVGIIGIGAIYQALSCGVPVIGAPEHLDQEYHLQRVAALGLGVKLDRRTFGARTIAEAVRQVLSDHSSYKGRCVPFIRHLEAWAGGGRAADLVDGHFHTAPQAYRVEDPFLVGEEEFVRCLEAATPDSLSAAELRSRLRAGIRHGLPHHSLGQARFFDRLDSWNWLYDRDPRFFGADYRALEQKRQRAFILRGGRLHNRVSQCRYRVTYTYRILPHDLLAGRRLKVFLPYPIHRPGQQEEIRLLRWAPGRLKEHWAPRLGFFYGYTFVPEGEGPWDFSYSCELVAREQRLEQASCAGELSPGERRHYLELEPGLLQQPEVARFRQALRPEGGALERARAIYLALAGSKRFKKTRDRTHNLTYSTVAVLRDNGGHCITLTQAFVALCRAEGIPAREAAGALLGYPAGEGRYVSRTWGEQLYGHTWAEIHVAEKGWLPVEFHSIAIAEQAMTPENVDDPELRAQILENSPRYRDYYFGNLDHQRVLCSNSVKRIPQCLVEDPAEPPGSRKRWQVLQEMPFSCSLQTEEC